MQYVACVVAGACDESNLRSHGIEGSELKELDKCNYKRLGREEHPINCVSHGQAKAYCLWAGGRLPSEQQWEKAAGGNDSWPYPNGDATIGCDKAVMSYKGDGCGRGTTWPVGSKPAGASPFGAVDMAGNVWEWVAGSYTPRHRIVGDAGISDTPEAEGTMMVVRGGGWRDQAPRLLRTSVRRKHVPGTHAIEVGFRCAYDDR